MSVLIKESAETAHEVARNAGDQIEALWAPEDPERILEDSHLFEPLPDGADDLTPELLSLRWRNEALLALASAGVLSLEDEIIRHTDRLFHAGLPSPV